MPRFPVNPAKEADLLKRMKEVGLSENDFEETFFKATNSTSRKASSVGVCIQHTETAIQVKSQTSSRRSLNRFLARRILVEELEARKIGMTREEKIKALKTKGRGKADSTKPLQQELPVEHMFRMFHRSIGSITGEDRPKS